MNRYDRYKESIQKFVTTSFGSSNITVDFVSKDKMAPILLLTVLNSQNKKNNISIQGYHLCISVECMLFLIKFYEDINVLSLEKLEKLLFMKNFALNLIACNLGDIKGSYSGPKINNIYVKALETFSNYCKQIDNCCNYKFDTIGINVHQDVSKWYLRDPKSANAMKLSQLNQIKKESFDKYIESSIAVVCEYAIIMAWIIGNGDNKTVNKLKQLGKCFAYVYKISQDFDNIINDINNISNTTMYSFNYVINYGLQESYNTFMKNKIRFTEDALTIDLLTPTIKEILDIATKTVDNIIDQTSPDIKSGFSKIF